jgi:iron complex outermembrane receptor protein
MNFSKKKSARARLFEGTTCLLALSGTVFLPASADAADTNQSMKSADASLDKAIEMSLSELQQVQVTAGSLDGSELRKAPATITTITSQEIRDSGARNLNELLEIYVPNLLYLRHNWEASHIGIRGAIGDVDNGFLILVNGRVMNNYVHAGALSERDLNLLGDIKEIQVVRGPGSAVYGAGALIGVIDIRTFNGESFQGTEATVTAGEVEQFYSFELKGGYQLGNRAKFFFYGGISDLLGADNGSAPLIPGLSGTAYNGTPVIAGKQYPLSLSSDRQSYHAPDLKFHTELTLDDFSLWARYTRGGEVQPLEQRWLLQPPQGFSGNIAPDKYQIQGVGSQQISAGTDYKHEISDHWEIAGRLGYGIDDYSRREFDGLLDANREDIYSARLLATWKSSDTHSLTFGAEYLHGEYGLPALGYPGGPARSVSWAGVNPTPDGVSGFMPRWSSDTFSFLAEDHWDITPKWSLFTDLRIDKNYQTDFMYSPRMALIYTPTSNDTFKLITSQAVKADVAETLEFQREISGVKGDTETLRSVELSYNRLLGEHFSVGINTFYNDFKPIGWNDALGKTTVVGDETIIGAELEVAYQTKTLRIGLSHGYSQLVNFDSSVQGIEAQAITAQPYGFGHDLNHWSTHITKLQFTYQPVEKLRFSGSLRVFWGWPGSKDYTDYANATGVDADGSPLEFLRDPNYNPYGKIQARLNLGATYAISKNCSISIHGYNLLGLVDGHLNDRFIMFSSSASQDAVAAMATFSCKF